jgi:hypothetical protein
MGCNGAYATHADYEVFWCLGAGSLDTDAAAAVDAVLVIAAADIHVNLASSGACDCDLAPWAAVYLKKLNVIDAAALYHCDCGPTLSADERQAWMDWITAQFELLRTGKLEVCNGETGADYLAIGWAEQNVNEFAQAAIIANTMQRNTP